MNFGDKVTEKKSTPKKRITPNKVKWSEQQSPQDPTSVSYWQLQQQLNAQERRLSILEDTLLHLQELEDSSEHDEQE